MTTRSTGFLLLLLAVAPLAHAGTTVDKIRKAHQLVCGLDQSEAEFSMVDNHGPRVSFDQDLCKAAAVAVLGPDAKVVIKGYPDDQTSLAALRSGEIDLIPSLSADFSHTTEPGIGFTRPVLYDGVALLVPTASGITNAIGLSGKKVCVLAETEVEVTLRSWFESHHLTFVPFPFQEQGEMEAAYVTNNCPGLAGDLTRLVETRESFGPLAKDYTLLPDILSKDPLAMAYRASDSDGQWGNILSWTINILIQAEESGVTTSTVKSPNTDPTIQRLLGKTRELGRPLGLEDAWAANVIAAVGNYGELFNRDLGDGSPLKLPRGLNALWNQGGLMYALPIR